MSQIVIRIEIPDGVKVSVVTEPDSVLSEPLPTEPGMPANGGYPVQPVIARTMAYEQPVGQRWAVGQVHETGHKPLRAGNKGGVFCPQKLDDGSWCKFRA